MFPSFTVFGKTIGTYGICAVCGFIVCGFVLSFIGRKKKIAYTDVILAILSVAIGLAIGGHLLYGITQYKLVIETFRSIGSVTFIQFILSLANAFGGSVFYGGFLGGLAGILVFLKIEKNLNKRDFLDLYGLGIPLFHTFGRIGCFLGGCCYGVECSFGFIVEHNEFSPGLEGVRRFPLQLLEALLNLILFFVLLLIYRHINKETDREEEDREDREDRGRFSVFSSESLFNGRSQKKTENRPLSSLSSLSSDYSGIILFLYMSIYPVYRFILEFFRGDVIRGLWGPFSTSQWVSIGIFIAGIIGTIITVKRKKVS